MFEKAYQFTKENEGGFSNHPKDKGGATIYGVASKYFPTDYQRIINSSEPEKLAKEFYQRVFWNPLYDKIFNEKLAIRLYDLSVNLGKLKAVQLLQKTFNDLSQVKIKEDGRFGQGTLKAVNLPPLEHTLFYDAYIKRVEAYYRSLSGFKTFGKGWLNRLHKQINHI